MHADLSYRSVLLRNSKFERAIAGLGNIRLRLSDPKHASGFYEKALSLKPDDDGTVTNYAVALAELGDVEGAKRQYKRAYCLVSLDPTPYYALGTVYEKFGRPVAAADEFRKALELKPGDPDTLAALHTLGSG